MQCKLVACRLLRGLALVPCLLAGFAVRAADSLPQALGRLDVSAGGYYAHPTTRIGASDKADQEAATFGLEDDLGFDDHQAVPRARVEALLGTHEGLSLDYYSIDRSHGRMLSAPISYRGNQYQAEADVRGKLNFDFGSAAWRWWLGEGSDAFGLGVGAAYYQVHASISGEATVGGQTAQASSSTRANAWAPMLQLGWRHAFNDQWRLYLDASGVKKNGGRLSGHVYNAALGLAWYPWQNVRFGAEYGYSRIRLDQRKTNYNARLDMKLSGPSLFVKLRF